MASSTSYAGSRSPPDGPKALKELLLVDRGELLLQPLHLRQVVEDDVRLVGVAGEIVLVILLRGIEVLERRHLGDDRTREDVGLVQLIDIGPRGLFLGLVRVEDRRTVLAPHIRALAVQDRKSTRLNSSHSQISYAVFCLKKKNSKTCYNCFTD